MENGKRVIRPGEIELTDQAIRQAFHSLGEPCVTMLCGLLTVLLNHEGKLEALRAFGHQTRDTVGRLCAAVGQMALDDPLSTILSEVQSDGTANCLSIERKRDAWNVTLCWPTFGHGTGATWAAAYAAARDNQRQLQERRGWSESASPVTAPVSCGDERLNGEG